ncbi:MAG: hypothetical protein U1F98_15805 [Verrucomicrobiota bacterium]
MKAPSLFVAAVSIAASVLAADPSPKDAVTAAAHKLGDQPNYTWKTTVEVPPDAQYRPGPTDGQTEKGGFTWVKTAMRDNSIEIVLKGDKAAVTNPDGGWQSVSELDPGDMPGRFLVPMIRNFKTPAEQAAEMAGQTKELKKDGDVISGDLTEDGAKAQLLRRRGGDATVADAKGSIKFWIKDGVLVKYEFKVSGKVNFNGNERDVERTTTVEIKDVGTTKLSVPEDAKKKLA